MLLKSTEMDIQFMKVFQKGSQRCASRHLGKRINILGETLATIAKLTIGTGNVGVGVVDVAGEEDAGVHLRQSAPICSQYSRQALK